MIDYQLHAGIDRLARAMTGMLLAAWRRHLATGSPATPTPSLLSPTRRAEISARVVRRRIERGVATADDIERLRTLEGSMQCREKG